MNKQDEDKAREIAQKYERWNIEDDESDGAYKGALEMAEWKDKNPSVETIKKIVVYALRRTNIMLADDLENEVEWELLIKNALNEN